MNKIKYLARNAHIRYSKSINCFLSISHSELRFHDIFALNLEFCNMMDKAYPNMFSIKKRSFSGGYSLIVKSFDYTGSFIGYLKDL